MANAVNTIPVYPETSLLPLPRYLLPYENPLGFGLQDYVGFGITLLFVLAASFRLLRKNVIALAFIAVAVHFLLTFALKPIRRPVPMHQSVPLPQQTPRKKQPSPFEEVK